MQISKIHKLMEWFWLVVAIFTFIIAMYVINKIGIEKGYHFLFPPLIAVILYTIRRGYRKKVEKNV